MRPYGLLVDYPLIYEGVVWPFFSRWLVPQNFHDVLDGVIARNRQRTTVSDRTETGASKDMIVSETELKAEENREIEYEEVAATCGETEIKSVKRRSRSFVPDPENVLPTSRRSDTIEKSSSSQSAPVISDMSQTTAQSVERTATIHDLSSRLLVYFIFSFLLIFSFHLSYRFIFPMIQIILDYYIL